MGEKRGSLNRQKRTWVEIVEDDEHALLFDDDAMDHGGGNVLVVGEHIAMSVGLGYGDCVEESGEVDETVADGRGGE